MRRSRNDVIVTAGRSLGGIVPDVANVATVPVAQSTPRLDQCSAIAERAVDVPLEAAPGDGDFTARRSMYRGFHDLGGQERPAGLDPVAASTIRCRRRRAYPPRAAAQRRPGDLC